MEAAGLLERRDDPTDGRLVRVWLTNRGRELAQTVPQVESKVIDDALSGFSEEERRQLIRLLGRVLENLEES